MKKQNEKSAGLTSTYMQQERILKQRGITSTPQTSCIDDLESFIKSKLKDGHEVLVALDANEQ